MTENIRDYIAGYIQIGLVVTAIALTLSPERLTPRRVAMAFLIGATWPVGIVILMRKEVLKNDE